MAQRRWILLAPEAVAALAVAIVFALCALHPSGEGEDIAFLERMVWLLPVVVVPAVFVTILLPGARSRAWLLRATIACFVALLVGAMRIVEGFGTGARGQDAALILVMSFGLVLVSLGLAIAGAIVLAHERPAFGAWFHRRRLAGSALTLLATLPIGFVLGVTLAFALGVLGGLWSAFSS